MAGLFRSCETLVLVKEDPVVHGVAMKKKAVANVGAKRWQLGKE